MKQIKSMASRVHSAFHELNCLIDRTTLRVSEAIFIPCLIWKECRLEMV